MDDVERRKELFAWYGSTAYWAQCFESEVRILLLLVARLQNRAISAADFDGLWSRLERNTLGQLLAELRQRSLALSPEFERMLQEYKETRNYLAHHFFYQNARKLMTAEGCADVLRELQRLHTQMSEANAAAEAMSEKVREWLGWSESALQAYVNEQFDAFQQASV